MKCANSVYSRMCKSIQPFSKNGQEYKMEGFVMHGLLPLMHLIRLWNLTQSTFFNEKFNEKDVQKAAQ
jgi:hypothetical protein